MFDYIRTIFTKPQIEMTPVDNLVLIVVVLLGLFLVAILGFVAVVIWQRLREKRCTRKQIRCKNYGRTTQCFNYINCAGCKYYERTNKNEREVRRTKK